MTEDDMLKLARECAATVWEQSVSVPDSYIRNGKMDSLMEVQSALAAIRIMHERAEKLAGAATGLRDDLLDRAEWDGEVKTVCAGNGAWFRFNDALDEWKNP